MPTPSVCEAHPPVRHPAGSCLLSGEPVSLDGLDTEGKRATQKFGEAGIPSRWLAPSSCRKLTSPDKQGHEVSHWMSLVLLADLTDRSVECHLSALGPFSQRKALIFGKREKVVRLPEKITTHFFDAYQPPFFCFHTIFLSGTNAGSFFFLFQLITNSRSKKD